MGRVFDFFAEIRDRRIFRIVISYLAAGWVVLEVADQFIERGLVPEFVYKVALAWYLVGIPACLLIGWHHGEQGRQKAPPSEIALLSLLAVLGVSLSVSPIREHVASVRKVAAAESGLDLHRLGVLYFNDLTRGGEEQHLADALTEGLIEELEQVNTLDVVSKHGTAQFRGAALPADSIARALDAGMLVGGTVERKGDRVQVTVRLLDGKSGVDLGRASFERPAGDPFAIRSELVKETSRFLREVLGEEIRVRKQKRETENATAWLLLQRAEKARKDAEAHLGRHDLAGMERSFREADALLARAETLDPAWAEPTVLRGMIDYRRSRVAHEPAEAVRWIREGMEHAERALRLSPEHAKALELRGTLRYWHFLLRVTPDPADEERLLHAAREDLEAAVAIDPTLASAYSTLSHLYANMDDKAAVVLAARKAYEEDAYLDVAPEVLWRLFTGSYDLQQFTQAKRWCDEGARRFSEDFRFTDCQLIVMTTPEVSPDVDRAWRLLDRLGHITPEPRRGYEVVRGQMLVGGVLARAGLADSARAVLSRAQQRADHHVDPYRELILVAAHMRTLAGDPEGAINLLQQYAAATPGYSFAHSWWWNPLRSHPRFQALAEGGHHHH